jgi:hypothetical protein
VPTAVIRSSSACIVWSWFFISQQRAAGDIRRASKDSGMSWNPMLDEEITRHAPAGFTSVWNTTPDSEVAWLTARESLSQNAEERYFGKALVVSISSRYDFEVPWDILNFAGVYSGWNLIHTGGLHTCRSNSMPHILLSSEIGPYSEKCRPVRYLEYNNH